MSSPNPRLRTSLLGAALVLVAVPFGLLLFLVQHRWNPLLRADVAARDHLHGYAVQHPLFVTVMKVLSTVGSGAVYATVFAVLAAWLVWRRLPRLALFVVITMLGSSLLNGAVKRAVARPRPVLHDPVSHAGGLSFPSGHAQSAMVAYAVLLLVFLPMMRGRLRHLAVAVSVVMVLGIGFSRLALGVHYGSDVLGGYVLGAAWVAAMTAAFRAWRRG